MQSQTSGRHHRVHRNGYNLKDVQLRMGVGLEPSATFPAGLGDDRLFVVLVFSPVCKLAGASKLDM